MAEDKPQMVRDETVQVIAQDYAAADKVENGESTEAAKAAMTKDNTMLVTAKEGEALLEASGKPDPDAKTRGEQKKIDEIQAEEAEAEEPTPKKPRISKDTTMKATASEAKGILGKEKLGDTRQGTKAKRERGTPKRASTMAKTMAEGQALLANEKELSPDASSGRRTRSQTRSPAKPAIKRAGTMQQTAKEGKEYLKRSRKGKKAAAPVEEEESIDDKKEAEENNVEDTKDTAKEGEPNGDAEKIEEKTEVEAS
ncbi:unnamed protein product [Owenia fusiformis]|uniref:Uncharacterized protein n=1 Tax=Owenia fusiformis TaxID=6347 RepID=A0A8S4N3G0_OWEFU|nr:unnamed protein product [Owenia fusiformis]